MTKCNVCESGALKVFLSFGAMPMGNGFVREGGDDPKFPMDLSVCGTCHAVQIEKPVPFEQLERVYKNYVYVPTGATLASHYADLGKTLAATVAKGGRVLDVGSNDGTLLASMLSQRPDLKVQGIEPAEELSARSRTRGIPVVTGFFNEETERQLAAHGPYDLITFTQVLQHIPSPVRALERAKRLLSPRGSIFVEGRYILDTVKEGAFDTFYQELLCEFGLLSLRHAMERLGLKIVAAERVPAYGGSLRIRAENGATKEGPGVAAILAEETATGLDKEAAYLKFGEDAKAKATRVRELVQGLGGRTVAYGAPSTGTTLLNYCHLGKADLDYVVDDNPMKQKLLVPGVGLRIESPETMERSPPDNVLVVPWRLEKDIVTKLAQFRARGGRVLVPLPEPHVLDPR